MRTSMTRDVSAYGTPMARRTAWRAHPADPALELIYLQAGCAARRTEQHERTRRALLGVDFTRLAEELRARRLLPLIGGRVISAAPLLCPDTFAAQVADARTAARAQALAVHAATTWVTRRLDDEGIRALPLKGPILAEEAHGDPGLRETADVDLLVPASRLCDAAALLQREGFEPPADRLMPNGLPALHLALAHRSRPTVELHWRVHWHEEELSRQMLVAARPGPDGLLRARPEDFCVCLLLFYARDGFHGVRMAADIASWWDRHCHALAPAFLEDYVRRYPALAGAFAAATAVLEDTTGTPSRAWLKTRAGGRGAAMGSRLADWTQQGDRDQLAANISLAGGLLGPAGTRRSFLGRELVPAQGPSGPHAAKMLARYSVALWHLRGGRRWAEPPPAPPARVELCGMPIDVITERQAIAHVIACLEEGRGGWVITPNLEQLRQFAHGQDLRNLFEDADLVVADGMPLVWASRLAGSPVPERVAGSDLVWSLSAEAALWKKSLFLLGGTPGVAPRAAETLRRSYPELEVAGVYSPPPGFEAHSAELEAIRGRLLEAQPDIVYVALGFPKQERLIAQLREEMSSTWFLGVGISFSFITGDVRRAPYWLQRIGFEWLHRLAMEPRRLTRRYVVHGLPFSLKLAGHAATARRRGGLPSRAKKHVQRKAAIPTGRSA